MADLLHLKTEDLKDAAQRLWQNLCAPTCDGKLISKQVYEACKQAAASGIEFVIGLSSHEANVFRSFVGDQKYADGIAAAVTDMQSVLDDATASAVQAYIEAQTAASNALEAKTKLVEQWNALCIYRTAVKLHAGGNPVHLLYWDEKPLIENLGSGMVDAAAALLGNADALQMYGGVMNAELSEMLQTLLRKFINGEELQLYHNEIGGVDAFDWKAFPQALIVSDGKFACDTIEDRITEVKGLLDYMVK